LALSRGPFRSVNLAVAGRALPRPFLAVPGCPVDCGRELDGAILRLFGGVAAGEFSNAVEKSCTPAGLYRSTLEVRSRLAVDE
jgi:hypothetical protein